MGEAQTKGRMHEHREERTACGAVSGGLLLTIDVGNSVTNLGLCKGEKLVSTWTATTFERMTADEARAHMAAFIQTLNEPVVLGDAIVASVVPSLTDAWVRAAGSLTGRRPLVVGPGLKTGVKMRYNDPGELGADRVADLAAAKETYECPFIVVDLGTTTNFEVVDRDGVFIGGIIAPGLKLSARAISSAAAQLSVIELKAPTSIIGKNTREALQSGIVMGEVARIDGLVDAVWQELGYTTSVIATGEDAEAMGALSQRVSCTDEHLTLHGLQVLHGLNRRS